MSKKDIENFLDRLAPVVRNNLTIRSKDEILGKSLYHISANNELGNMIPRIGDAQLDGEDRTVPRICLAATILGCLMGYGRFDRDFKERERTKEEGFTGGYVIYDLDFEFALQPGAKNVQDAKETGEYWLVAYNEDTAKYKPKPVGKVFALSITLYAQDKSMPHAIADMAIEVTKKEGIAFSKRLHLDEGYWRVSGNSPKSNDTWKDDEDYVVQKLTQEDYDAYKRQTASLLSAPVYMDW